jgi:hypothetical protein
VMLALSTRGVAAGPAFDANLARDDFDTQIMETWGCFDA